jgi:hypothetical protein
VFNKSFSDVIGHLKEICDLAFVYINRRLEDLIYSSIMQKLTGDLGNFARHNYNVDSLIASFIQWEMSKEKYFRKLNTKFLELKNLPKSSLAGEILFQMFSERYQVCETKTLNTTSEKLKQPEYSIFFYPLRMMINMSRQNPPHFSGIQ